MKNVTDKITHIIRHSFVRQQGKIMTEEGPEETWAPGPMLRTPFNRLEDRYVLNGYFSPSAEWGSPAPTVKIDITTTGTNVR